MEDDKSTKDVYDISSDDDDTSVADTTESTDTEEVEATEESNDSESEDTEEQDSEDEPDSDKTDDDEESGGDESDEDTQEGETPQQRSRREYQERQARRQQATEQQNAKRQEQADAFLAEAEDEKDEAIRQLQVENYFNKVERVESSIANDFESAQRDIDLFNPQHESFNQRALDAALSEYEAGYIRKDQAGNVVQVAKPLKQYLRDKADLYEEFLHVGARNGQKAERNMRAKGDPVPSRPPQKTKSDPIMDALLSD